MITDISFLCADSSIYCFEKGASMYKIAVAKLDQPICADWKEVDAAAVPATSKEEYEQRLANLWNMPESQKYAGIIIYGDREHYFNIHYLTGFDPRFEEALLIVKRGAKPILVVGIECFSYVKGLNVDVDVVLYQTFGLMGQPNSDSKMLDEILADAGIPDEGKVGLTGWKYYDPSKHCGGGLLTDVPYYIVDAASRVYGMERLENATDLFMDCQYGLRHNVSATEIVQFEYSGTKVSRGVYNCIDKIRPGVSEIEATKEMLIEGSPQSIHPNLNFGDDHMALGVASPGHHRTLSYGDMLGIGYAYRGSLVHKAGIYARGPEDVPEEKKAYLEDFVKPYFATVIKWYEMLQIGGNAVDIYNMVDEWIGFEKFGMALNPGHMTHTDEWTNTPFYPDSKVRLTSGMAFQCDYTVTFHDPYMVCHVEDGVVIADEKLREEIKKTSPECWERIQARRDFMINVMHADLPEEVLPLSDLPGVCFPYMADTRTILIKEL